MGIEKKDILRQEQAQRFRDVVSVLHPAYIDTLTKLGVEGDNNDTLDDILNMGRVRLVEFASAVINSIAACPPEKIPEGYAEAAARQTQLSRILKNYPGLGAECAIGLVNFAVNGRSEVIADAISDFKELFVISDLNGIN